MEFTTEPLFSSLITTELLYLFIRMQTLICKKFLPPPTFTDKLRLERLSLLGWVKKVLEMFGQQ